MRFVKDFFLNARKGNTHEFGELTVEELTGARKCVIGSVQSRVFSDELQNYAHL